MEQTIGLTSVDGASIALRSVQIEGQINGLLLSTSIRQQYRNDSDKALEIVYMEMRTRMAALLLMKLIKWSFQPRNDYLLDAPARDQDQFDALKKRKLRIRIQSALELLEYFDKQALAHQDFAQVLKLVQHLVAEIVQNMIADFAKQGGITLEQG